MLTDISNKELNNSSKFFNLLINYFLSGENNLEEASNKIEQVFLITARMKNEDVIADLFVHNLSKYLLKLLNFKRSFNIFGEQVNYFSLIKIMRGVFKLQEKYSNLGEKLTLFLNFIKFYCLILLPMHLFEDEFTDVVETNKILNFLRIILNSSVDFQSYLFDFNPDILNRLVLLKEFLFLCKEIISFPQKLNDVNERRQFFNSYKNFAITLDLFSIIKDTNNIPEFPSNMIMEKIILLEPQNNLEDSVEIDSKFIAKLDIVFDIYNIKVRSYFY